MSSIQSLIDATEDYMWDEIVHDTTLKNILVGEKLAKANMTPYMEYLKFSSPEHYRGVMFSTAKSANAYSVNTEGVNEARMFIEKGTVPLHHLIIERINPTIKLHPGTAIIVSTRFPKSPFKLYFWDEIESVGLDAYGWRLNYKGVNYGGSTTCLEHDAMCLLRLGKQADTFRKKETLEAFKRYMEEAESTKR